MRAHLPLRVVLGAGSSNDKKDATDPLVRRRDINNADRLCADAFYDADLVSQFCRETWNAEV